jgi:flagellar biogenesis protein FliO
MTNILFSAFLTVIFFVALLTALAFIFVMILVVRELMRRDNNDGKEG